MKKFGLYDPQNEHDACGIGMMVNLKGGKTHQLVDSSLTLLENMKHRGAEAADNKSGVQKSPGIWRRLNGFGGL